MTARNHPLHRLWRSRWASLMIGAFLLAGCAAAGPAPGADRDPVEACYEERARAIREKAPLDCLTTLEGRCVPLEPFFQRCSEMWPSCVLYPKFYYWPSSVEERVSETPDGPVVHRIRLYFNLRSTCDPGFVDPGRTHGDVAEFYDENGNFMGLAVYMGEGNYAPLPFEP